MPSPSALRNIKDPQRRALAAAKEFRRRAEAAEEVRTVRDEAAEEMLTARTEDGGRYLYRPVDVANAIGVTRAAIAKRFRGVRDDG